MRGKVEARVYSVPIDPNTYGVQIGLRGPVKCAQRHTERLRDLVGREGVEPSTKRLRVEISAVSGRISESHRVSKLMRSLQFR